MFHPALSRAPHTFTPSTYVTTHLTPSTSIHTCDHKTVSLGPSTYVRRKRQATACALSKTKNILGIGRLRTTRTTDSCVHLQETKNFLGRICAALKSCLANIGGILAFALHIKSANAYIYIYIYIYICGIPPLAKI